MEVKKMIKQLCLLALIVLIFLLLNLSVFELITRRLDNNFGGTDSAKMIDVSRFLPFEEASKLAKTETDFRLSENLPVLDGAAALVPVYAAIIDNIYPEGCVTYEGGSFSDDNFYGENFAQDSKMQYKNSVRGFDAIINGDTDIFFCAMPSNVQKEKAEELQVELEYIPIGYEAFVFFVNSNNPVNSLTTEQIREIYDGSIKKWSEVGGTDEYINPLTRLEGSGSQNAMESFMGERKTADKSPMACFGKSIGYSFRYYLNDLVADSNVKMLALNGVYPDKDSIRNGEYPVVMQFFAVVRKDNANPNVGKLIDWILSEEGQKLIEDTGYVGVR